MKKLTKNQVAWLDLIPAEGIATNTLLDLSGEARKYAMKYERSLLSAISAHNAGTASNSPIDSSVKIEAGPFGPRGGQGYRLTRDPLTQVAIDVLVERS